MSGVAAGWLPLVFTTLGGGAVGSLIASYGSQARPSASWMQCNHRRLLRDWESSLLKMRR